jgi:hypothetical protein
MDAFSLNPPTWVETAVHAQAFCCPRCQSLCTVAQKAWINRRAPVYMENQGRKWQEFYECECGCVWWAWSSDRPPSPLRPQDL